MVDVMRSHSGSAVKGSLELIAFTDFTAEGASFELSVYVLF